MSIREFEGNTPRINESAYIDDTALIIGDVEIGQDSSVWPFTIIRGDVNSIRIGKCSNIQDHSVLHVSHKGPYNPKGNALYIGSNVTVGHRVTLHGCTVMDNCLIGMGATVMDGAIVHPNNLIGAGSLITPDKELEGGYLWIGSPVRRTRKLTEEEISSIQYSAEHYFRLKNRHIKL
ncbi:MAG: gamma carbonic anhydrase family protein [Gammaproteobacteria bacterium]|nr:gamma carbonic anhydrase family protein [Gammaproteobacteria bacterium]